MGTRGLIGFVIDGEKKFTYNHYGSYPEVLGQDVLNFIHENSIEYIKEKANAIKLVKENSIPTEDDINRCQKYLDLSVSKRSNEDWYCLLRKAQGDLKAYCELGIMVDSKEFLDDALFCEHAYIINLDKEELEYYYGETKPSKRFKLNDCPDNWKAFRC